MWRRSLLILAAVCLCFGAVGGKLAVIQIGEYAVWQERAMEQQMSNSIISPKRGLIYDTNMEVLAQTKEVATIIMAPSEIPDEATRTLIADELSVLLEINRDALYKKTGKKTSLYEVIKAKIDHSLCDTFIDWVQEHQFTGIFRVNVSAFNCFKSVNPSSPGSMISSKISSGSSTAKAFFNALPSSISFASNPIV